MWCVAIINTCSPINICSGVACPAMNTCSTVLMGWHASPLNICMNLLAHFQDFSSFLHLLIALSFSSSSFVCSEFLSAISQKFKQESIEIYFLCFGENIFLLHRYLFAFIVPLFYTEKGNCFSLTRFTQHFFLLSSARIQIFKCIFPSPSV